ncbi:phospholipase D-like domain-containing protein [Thaumasiovibrio subtropicus]|uniref:phospholipase D-like domain-containing protein n=1 Tax=Thaumasiovibrio subtropicus TaxID=1891207 RepID=UPI000B35DAAC|nr:phospholipase D family protein [Thaumasiovibrio subtropicus]
MLKRIVKLFVYLSIALYAVAAIWLDGFVALPPAPEPQTPVMSLSQSLERASIIESPSDALDIRLSLFANATQRIDVVYHNVKWDPSSQQFFMGLVSAANRGVEVTIILDSLMGGLPNRIALALHSHPHINVYYYGKPTVRDISSWNNRLHDKFVVVDETYALMGGRNIADKYFAPAHYDGAISHDRDVFIVNDIKDPNSGLAQLSYYVHQLLKSPYTVALEQPSKPGFDRTPFNSILLSPPRALQDWVRETLPVDSITLVHNPITAGFKSPQVASTLHALVADAEHSVLLQSPYIVPTTGIYQAIDDLASHVDVRFITNSTSSTPNFPAYSAYLNHKPRLLEKGITVYEYLHPADSIHGKSLLIDDRFSVIGSFNLDPRSLYLSTESMLIIEGEMFAQQLKSQLKRIQNQSMKLTRYSTDDEHARTQQAPWYKIWFLNICRVIGKPFELLL